jgi:hypothetical protein
MNKAKFYRRALTRETRQYWDQTKDAAEGRAAADMRIAALDVPIPDRVDIKRAIPGRFFPTEYRPEFKRLWENIKELVA